MTQALNLANFANNLNTSGATTNAGLQNSSVTVTAGTGMSGGGAVSLGSSVTLTNAGVTSIVAGTGITISGATGAVTVNSSGAVSSVNGQTGAVVTTTAYAIGSVIYGRPFNVTAYSAGDTIAGSSLYATSNALAYFNGSTTIWDNVGGGAQSTSLINTGSWRCVSLCSGSASYGQSGIWARYA